MFIYSSSSCTIEDLLNKWGLQGAEIPLKDFDADQGNVGGSSLSDLHTIHMLEITSKGVEWKIPATPWWSITLNEPWKWLVSVEPFLPVMSLLRCNICSLDCSVTLLARNRIAPFLQDPANLFLSLYMMFTCFVGEVQFNCQCFVPCKLQPWGKNDPFCSLDRNRFYL